MSAKPAAAGRAVMALTTMELRLLARRGENVLATLVIPVAVLLFFGGTALLQVADDPVRALVPGTIAIGVIAAGFVSLGIATAYERQYGVLKRLGGAPIRPWLFLAAKVLSVLVLEAIQVCLLMATAAVVFGWAPGEGWSPLGLVLAVLLGTATFVGLGLLFAGILRAEAVLALANGLFLVLLMLGGVIVPVDHLPPVIEPLAAVLPSAALVELVRSSVDPALSPSEGVANPLGVMIAWAAASTLLAAWRFRWD